LGCVFLGDEVIKLSIRELFQVVIVFFIHLIATRF